MDEYFDLIVIGGGPAGLTAGIYGARARLKTLVLEKGNLGGRAYTTREIVNYPSQKFTSGPDLAELMVQQAKGFGVDIRTQTVRSVDFSGDDKIVNVRKASYHAKAVVIATGTSPRILNIPGEADFTGAGVSYCATCDAEFYTDEDVVVLGSGDQAIEESEFIAKFANSVTIIVVHDEGVLDCNKLAAEQAMKNPKLHFIFNSTLAEVYGHDTVEGVKVKDLRSGELSDLPCQGVFFFCGMIPATQFLADALPLDSRGWIHTGEDMSTGVAGVFAAGDVRNKYLRQIATAVGDGASAATAAERYINEIDFLNNEILSGDCPTLLAFWDSGIEESMQHLSTVLDGQDTSGMKVVEIDVAMKKNIAAKYKVELTKMRSIQLVKVDPD